jgi:hypothetical protein
MAYFASWPDTAIIGKFPSRHSGEESIHHNKLLEIPKDGLDMNGAGHWPRGTRSCLVCRRLIHVKAGCATRFICGPSMEALAFLTRD